MGAPTTNRRNRRARCARVQMGAVACALASGLGCAAHFQPTVPMRAQTMDVDLTLESVRVGGTHQLVYDSRSTVPHQVGHAWVTVPTRVPCSGGLDVEELTIDGGRGAPGVLPASDHQIRGKFGRGPDVLGLDLVLDVELEEGRCLRAPAVSQSIPFEAARRFVLVSSLDLNASSDLTGMRAIYGFRVGGGGWIGPVLATAVVGVGGASCNEGTCGKDADNMLRSGRAFPASLDVRYSMGSSTRGILTNILMVGARYSITSARLPALDGDRRFVVHGFQGVFSWALTDGVRGPFRHPERMALAEIAIPIGVSWAPDAPATNHLVFAAGVDLRFLIPM